MSFHILFKTVISHLSFDLYDWFVWFLIDLYILETTPLLDICITNIFHCVSSYHFLVVSFKERKFLMLHYQILQVNNLFH